ncbi:MAG: oxidoreductase [Nitrospirales bacterium]|nr:MAG: oxidoreductase [Nitrospirales bacterium]
MKRVSGKLSAGSPTGYSASGVIVAVGDQVEGFSIGDRVACAGAGIANHAEVIDVPVNLSVSVPDELSMREASTVTLGAIAMQGVRRAEASLGETIVVIGLGVLGQMAVQMLTASGVTVIGIDLDPSRIELAKANGMDYGINPAEESVEEVVSNLTGAVGADCAFITAASSSDEIVSQAASVCRKKGKVVLVGDVGLKLRRSDFYAKELDFKISCSYGPGRYDPYYEEEGQDYPLAYVRWTENRNMELYLELIKKGKLNIQSLLAKDYDIEDAGDAYDSLKNPDEKPLLVTLKYSNQVDISKTKVELSKSTSIENSTVRVGLIGASSFAQGVHIPNLIALSKQFSLVALSNRTSSTAKAVAKQIEAAYCTTNYKELLADENIDLLIASTRHDTHGQIVLDSIRAGKHVFMEKPLTTNPSDIKAIRESLAAPNASRLFVGYNRRFSPAIAEVRKHTAGRKTPVIVNYRMNAGYIPNDSWIQGVAGGGRNIGEACHIYDLFNCLAESTDLESVSAVGVTPNSEKWRSDDNFVATLKYRNGSVCTLTYTALGSKKSPKEMMTIYCDQKVIEMNDFTEVKVHSTSSNAQWSAKTVDKGHKNEMKAMAAALLGDSDWPQTVDEAIVPAETAFAVQAQLEK